MTRIDPNERRRAMTRARQPKVRVPLQVVFVAVSIVIGVSGGRAAATSASLTAFTPNALVAHQSVETTPEEPTTPDTTTPETPPETEPTDPTTEPGASDDPVDPLSVALGILGFVVLLAVAGWWMIKRVDPDSQPHPPPDDDSATPGSHLI